MSLDPMLWALNDAPVADQAERLILIAMSDKADEDGCNAYQSPATIARRALCSTKTVRDKLKAMRQRGLIAYGDQSANAHIPANRRGPVYDLQIPYSWFPNIDRINDARTHRGRPPLTPPDRPDLVDAPEPKRRKDAGVPRTTGKWVESSDNGPVIHRVESNSTQQGGIELHPENPQGGIEVPARVESNSTNSPHKETLPSTSAPREPNRPTAVDNRRVEGEPYGESKDVATVLDAAQTAFGFGARTRADLAPRVAQRLADGHRAGFLATRLSTNPGGVVNAGAVCRARLDDLPDPPSAAPRPAVEPHCGQCAPNRWIEDDDGRPVRKCGRCHPDNNRRTVAATSASTPPPGTHPDLTGMFRGVA